MTDVSIPPASATALPQLIKAAADSAQPNPPIASAFLGQLQAAIEDWKGGTKKDSKQSWSSNDKPDAEKKRNSNAQQTAAVPALQIMPPVPAPGAFGMPSVGVEPGVESSAAAVHLPNSRSAVEPIAVAELAQAPSLISQSAATLLTTPVASPTEGAAPTGPKAELAFALRLADATPSRQSHKPELDPNPQQPMPVERLIGRVRLQAVTPPSVQPGVALEQTSTSNVMIADKNLPSVARAVIQNVSPSPVGSAQVSVRRAARQTPSPANIAPPSVSGVTPSGSGVPESGSHAANGEMSNKDAQKETPKIARARGDQQPQPEPPTIGTQLREPSPQTPSPAAIVDRPIPPTVQTPESSTHVASSTSVGSVPAATPPLHGPTSQVTDVSVAVPLPRADGTTEDRVAIRMVQKGAEIHVSVRTPDNQLTQSLRQDLGKLSSGLDQAGFHTESWRPVATNASAQSNSNPQREPSQANSNRDPADSGGQSDSQSGRSPGDQRRRHQDDRPRWVTELEQQRNQ